MHATCSTLTLPHQWPTHQTNTHEPLISLAAWPPMAPPDRRSRPTLEAAGFADKTPLPGTNGRHLLNVHTWVCLHVHIFVRLYMYSFLCLSLSLSPSLSFSLCACLHDMHACMPAGKQAEASRGRKARKAGREAGIYVCRHLRM